jgi:hypothetical protein
MQLSYGRVIQHVSPTHVDSMKEIMATYTRASAAQQYLVHLGAVAINTYSKDQLMRIAMQAQLKAK